VTVWLWGSMTLASCAALVTLGMFFWSFVRWAGQHWQWVILSLIPLIGAVDGVIELALGQVTALIVSALLVNSSGFVLFRVLPAAGATGVEMLEGFGSRVIVPVGRSIRRFVGYETVPSDQS
jgi:hypothetical protein